VPYIARWPGSIPAGRSNSQVMAFWDFLPTCADLAGAPPPAGIDGISMLPALLGQKQKSHEYLYWEFHERGFHQAVRMGDWKAVRFGRTQPVELYNLQSDLAESNNVAAANPEVVRHIEQILATARTDSPDWPVSDKPYQ
jgi:arylsulfatase A-like enzyme